MRAYLSAFLKKNPDKWEDDEPFFPEAYTRIERIIHARRHGEHKLFVIKWKELGYEDCTWEKEEEVVV